VTERAADVVREGFEKASRLKDPSGRSLDVLDPDTLAAAYESFHPEIEVHEDPRFPEAGTYRGLDAVSAYFESLTDSFDEFVLTAEDFIELDSNRALMLFRLRTRGKASGATVEESPGWIHTVRDGKTVKIEAYLERSEALAAAGLSAPDT
jgi:ketosteroid isomerase-like protein